MFELSDYDDLTKKITDSSKEEKEMEQIEMESQLLQTALEKLIAENARTTINQTDYAKKYNHLAEKHNTRTVEDALMLNLRFFCFDVFAKTNNLLLILD